MYGFITYYGEKDSPISSDFFKNGKHIQSGKFQCLYCAMPRFEKDKLFFEDQDKVALLDGVILNKSELIKKYQIYDWKELFNQIYSNDKEKFMDELRGPFRGLIYNKRTQELFSFTNHSGEKTVFHSCVDKDIVIASHTDLIVEFFKKNNIKYELDKDTAIQLLTAGYALYDNTPVESIKRLTAGKCISFDGTSCIIKRYHMFRNVPELEISEEEAIKEIDRLYRQAIYRIFSKNEEYGYQHEADMSGGLDTRMVNWVAHDLGFKNVVNVNYCQPNSFDYKIAKKISKDLNNDFNFYSLEDGKFLYDIDELIGLYGGQVLYFLSTGANNAYKQIKEKNIGMASTGLVGEMCNAYWRIGDTHTPSEIVRDRYSSILKLTYPDSYFKEFDNYEHCAFYSYSLGFYLTSGMVRTQWCEYSTPYVDKDFVEFMFRMPLKSRMDYKIYTKWIMNYYPEAGSYMWQNKRKPLNKKVYIPKIIDDLKNYPIRVINKICDITNINYKIAYKLEMNPFEVWYKTNKKLSQFIEKYFTDNIDKIEDDDLKQKISKVYSSENAVDKLIAINLLGVVKRYFSEGK